MHIHYQMNCTKEPCNKPEDRSIMCVGGASVSMHILKLCYVNLRKGEITRDGTRSSMAWFIRSSLIVVLLHLAWWNRESSEIKGKLWIQWSTDGYMPRRGRQNRWSDLFWWNSRYVLSLRRQNSRWRCAANQIAECISSKENKLFLIALAKDSTSDINLIGQWADVLYVSTF